MHVDAKPIKNETAIEIIFDIVAYPLASCERLQYNSFVSTLWGDCDELLRAEKDPQGDQGAC